MHTVIDPIPELLVASKKARATSGFGRTEVREIGSLTARTAVDRELAKDPDLQTSRTAAAAFDSTVPATDLGVPSRTPVLYWCTCPSRDSAARPPCLSTRGVACVVIK